MSQINKPVIVFSDRAYVKNFSLGFMRSAFRLCTFTHNALSDKTLKKYRVHDREPETVCLAEIKGNVLSVPRGFPFQDFEEMEEAAIIDERKDVKPSKPFPKKMRKPLKDQMDPYLSIKKAARDDPIGCFFLVLPVSSGKTTIASLLACDFNQRTLICVDSTVILEGWMKDLQKIFNIHESAIGVIQGKTRKIGEHFTLAMMQTIRSQGVEDLMDAFGCMIIDECHTVPARTFYPIIDSFKCKYKIGISASRKRKDGLQCILHMLFNGEYYVKPPPEGDTSTSMQVSSVRFIPTAFAYNKPMTGSRAYTNFKKAICTDESRNRLIALYVAKEISLGNYCLIACLMKVQAESIMREVEKLLPAQSKRGVLIYMTGENKSRAKLKDMITAFDRRELRALFTTYQFVVKGSNIPILNRLFICGPIGFFENVSQLVGRIKRKHPYKFSAVVYDFVDPLVVYERTGADSVRRHHRRSYVDLRIPGFRKEEEKNEPYL